MTPPLEGQRILVTGPAGQVALPVCRALAVHNEVFGLARFSDPAARARAVEAGVVPIAADLAESDLAQVPDDLDYVLHFAVVRTGDFDYDLRANAEGAGRLLARCASAKAFLHCSSTAVYELAGRTPLAEDAPLGDSHRKMFPTYSIAKIAAETVVRFASGQWGVPLTVARLGVPYGDGGGWPLYHLIMMKRGIPIPLDRDAPNVFSPIHDDDILATLPGLLAAARVGGNVFNWTGAEAVSVEDWCGYLAELTGLTPRFDYGDAVFGSIVADSGKLAREVGRPAVSWRDGMRRMLEANRALLEG